MIPSILAWIDGMYLHPQEREENMSKVFQFHSKEQLKNWSGFKLATILQVKGIPFIIMEEIKKLVSD